ncbi:hypothetical protein KC19_8G047600 [Ceratodon purpureus]|uniref:Uncharacterized protein n=1 Tax=Ceratodon purpureus TaxID=3225 RepID=A0A8T0GZN0_CERPU|nr:hypothetical protein KC19_8G047600 [Ceratodon purpureus]
MRSSVEVGVTLGLEVVPDVRVGACDQDFAVRQDQGDGMVQTRNVAHHARGGHVHHPPLRIRVRDHHPPT